MQKEWFAEWFDSPYYHTLYKNHDEQDAQTSLNNLLLALQLTPGATILDLACGKGRHARFLAQKGYDVTGLDISPQSIAFARQFEHNNLAFYQHDMRRPFRHNYYDAVMNMFTSFGYFSNDDDHLKTLVNVARGLRPGGVFLLDYFNSVWVRRNMTSLAVKTEENITFHLHKEIVDGRICKTVTFEAEGRNLTFTEKVRLFELADFQQLFQQAGLELRTTLGDYSLSGYHAETSPRLILIARKANP